VEVVVVKGEASLPRDECASLFPARNLRNELVRRRQLDVDLQLVFDAGEGAEEPVGLRLHLDVDVDGARPPTVENGCGSSREVEAHVAVRFLPELPHEPAETVRVYRPAHSAAFSKLTSRP